MKTDPFSPDSGHVGSVATSSPHLGEPPSLLASLEKTAPTNDADRRPALIATSNLTRAEYAAVSMNALSHGNQIEVDLIADRVAARWRLRRIWRLKTAMLDFEMDSRALDL